MYHCHGVISNCRSFLHRPMGETTCSWQHNKPHIWEFRRFCSWNSAIKTDVTENCAHPGNCWCHHCRTRIAPYRRTPISSDLQRWTFLKIARQRMHFDQIVLSVQESHEIPSSYNGKSSRNIKDNWKNFWWLLYLHVFAMSESHWKKRKIYQFPAIHPSDFLLPCLSFPGSRPCWRIHDEGYVTCLLAAKEHSVAAAASSMVPKKNSVELWHLKAELTLYHTFIPHRLTHLPHIYHHNYLYPLPFSKPHSPSTSGSFLQGRGSRFVQTADEFPIGKESTAIALVVLK